MPLAAERGTGGGTGPPQPLLGHDESPDRDVLREPPLPAAKVLLHCRTTDVVRAGDHDLVLGTVTEADTGDPATAPAVVQPRLPHPSAGAAGPALA